MGLQITSSNADGMREIFRTYCALNKREDEQLFVDQARKYATDVFEVYKEAAPTREKIAGDVRKLGWNIPAFFGNVVRDAKGRIMGGATGARLSRGVPQNWLGLAWEKRQKRAAKKGRRTKQNHVDEQTFMGIKPTLAQMQAFVIKYRVAKRFSVASGWLPAVMRFGGMMKGSNGKIGRGHGSATLTRTEGQLQYTFTNAMPHAAEEDAKHGLIEKAKARWRANAMTYIHLKLAEQLAAMRRGSGHVG